MTVLNCTWQGLLNFKVPLNSNLKFVFVFSICKYLINSAWEGFKCNTVHHVYISRDAMADSGCSVHGLYVSAYMNSCWGWVGGGGGGITHFLAGYIHKSYYIMIRKNGDAILIWGVITLLNMYIHVYSLLHLLGNILFYFILYSMCFDILFWNNLLIFLYLPCSLYLLSIKIYCPKTQWIKMLSNIEWPIINVRCKSLKMWLKLDTYISDLFPCSS